MIIISKTDREKIVGQEMVKLFNEGYISEKEFMNTMNAYKQYAADQEQKVMERQQEVQQHIDEPKQQKKPALKKEVKQPKEKTTEQIRERNITWLLILGVSFLLISGLVVATSTWEQMGALLKVVTLLGVSVFFLGLSGISSKLLKIEKTAFAFLTLGSLLLPIAIIAIGYFGLFGDYLTLTGEGKYLLGVICTLLPLPLYFRNAVKNDSRLFVWIFYLFMSFFIGFAIASTNVSVDVFYFLIMVYNALLLYGYHQNHDRKTFRIFIKELPAYAQLNLIVSTLLMLVVFDQALFYSFNVLLTAALYIAMVFVYNTKYYQLVFSALFAYGVYQLTEHSWLQEVDLFIYSLLGVAYLVFAYLMRNQTNLSKVFHYTSGIISLGAFIYISYEGLLILENNESWMILLAYLTIAGTYIYLSTITEKQVFRWLASLFIFTFGLQLWDLIIEPFVSIQLFLFLYASVLFMWIGIRTNYTYLKAIKVSTFYVSIFVMLISIMYGLVMATYMEVFFMFFLFGCLALIVETTRSNIMQKIAVWIYAISWLLALVVLYPELTTMFVTYHENLNIPFHLAASGLILLAISFAWKKAKKPILEKTSFYTGQASYLMAMFMLLSVDLIEAMFVRPVILLVGIAVAIWLVRYTKIQAFWSIVAILSFSFYSSLINTFSLESFESIVLFMLLAPVLLLAVDRFAGKHEPSLKVYFFWLAHLVLISLVQILLLDQLMDQLLHPVLLLIPFLLYVYSTWVKAKEWEIKLFLYATLTTITLILMTSLSYYTLLEYIPLAYCLIVSSVLFLLIWLLAPSNWKGRIEWYLIPFSIFSLMMVLSVEHIQTLLELIILTGFIILILYLLHVRKWFTFTVIPLLLSLVMWEQQMYIVSDKMLFSISVGCFFALLIAGRLIYSDFYKKEDQQWLVDWYSIIAIVYGGYAMTLLDPTDTVWIRIIPYLLFALWLFLQVSRISNQLLQKVFITLGSLFFLPVYYLVLLEYLEDISDLFHAELVVLPVLVLSIVLGKRIWSNYQHIMTHIQSVLLVIITVYLVMDAIQSNTVWDALIVGTLSIVALLSGMKFQIKSYFFVGLGTLLFNVIYQTKPYWGNMPWWAYLLIAGITLIAIASYNEWTKQKQTEGKLEKKIKQVIHQFKKWN